MRRSGARSLAGILIGALASGCVLADPPATLPLVAEYAPVIQTASVVPSYVPPVTTWPGTFIVPVFLSDPTRTVLWKVIVSESGKAAPDVYPGMQAGNASGITTINFSDGEPLGNLCATVTLVVAYGWSNSNPDVPDSQGGDSVTWRYQPTASCTFYDAGASLNDASFPDGSTDGP